MSDRTVHGKGVAHDEGAYEVVRYDRSGRWWLEFATGKRRPVTLDQAVAAADVMYPRKPGGRQFDARWDRREMTTPDPAPNTAAGGVADVTTGGK